MSVIFDVLFVWFVPWPFDIS